MTTTHVCSWGIADGHQSTTGLVGSGSGIVYGFEKGEEPILAPEHNEIGQVIAQTQYDEHGTINCTLQIAHGVTPPSRGTIVTIDSTSYYVNNSSLTESNQAYARYSISLERYARTGSGFVVMATGAFSGS